MINKPDIHDKDQLNRLSDLNNCAPELLDVAQTLAIHLMGEKGPEYCKLERAFVAGFNLCLEGKVQVHRRDFEKEVRDLLYCVENCGKNELAVARQIARIREYLEPNPPKVEGDWVVRDKEPL